jgi:hypothetical protein
MWEYNSDIDQKTKIPIKARWWVKVLKVIFATAMITLTIAVMVYYQDFMMKEKAEKEKSAAETSKKGARILQEPSGNNADLTATGILMDFASDFVDPKAVGYGFLL